MRWLPLVTLVLPFPGCRESPTAPENPPSSLVVTAVSPSSGATVVVPSSYAYHVPGGVVLLRAPA